MPGPLGDLDDPAAVGGAVDVHVEGRQEDAHLLPLPLRARRPSCAGTGVHDLAVGRCEHVVDRHGGVVGGAVGVAEEGGDGDREHAQHGRRAWAAEQEGEGGGRGGHHGGGRGLPVDAGHDRQPRMSSRDRCSPGARAAQVVRDDHRRRRRRRGRPPRARSPRCSARTAPARPPRSSASRACSARMPGRCRCSAPTRGAPGPTTAPGSA